MVDRFKAGRCAVDRSICYHLLVIVDQNLPQILSTIDRLTINKKPVDNRPEILSTIDHRPGPSHCVQGGLFVCKIERTEMITRKCGEISSKCNTKIIIF